MFFRLEYYLITMQSRLADVHLQLVPTPLECVDRISILPILFTFAERIHDLLSLPLSLFKSASYEKALSQRNCTSLSDDQVVSTQRKVCLMNREEVRFVMEKIELFCCQEGDDDEDIGECLGGDEVTAMFEEKEPSLEELKQTFNVFDRNKDGFIDAQELHIVLGLLGSNKGIFLHDCKRMIARFDHNKDGQIDFNEFVKFMEVALS